MSMSISKIRRELKGLSNPEKKKVMQRFFKTGKGEYGEGDVFLGLTVPEQRKVAKKYVDISIDDVQKLLNSKIHEHRQVALIILIEKFKKSDDKERKKIFEFYLKNTDRVNNWDLVDISAPKIVGGYLLNNDRKVLYSLAESEILWERRISIVSTYAFIKNSDFGDTLDIAEILLDDKHDLIHKAVGWMLREVGKKNQSVLESFLKKYHKVMPRTMLRYSIERFDKKKREFYMKK